MEICNLYNWQMSMMTYYDFMEQFLSLGVLIEDDIVKIMDKHNIVSSPSKEEREKVKLRRNGSDFYKTPEPEESQVLNFGSNKKSEGRLRSGGADSAENSANKFIEEKMKVEAFDTLSKRGLIKNLHRMCLHLCHFIASNYLTDTRVQREIGYLIVVLARKMLRIENYENDVLRRLYRIEKRDSSEFIRCLEELEDDFKCILDNFEVDLHEFKDGLGQEKVAFGPFGPFDLVEREYDYLGNAISEQLEDREKKLRREKIKKKRENSLKIDLYNEVGVDGSPQKKQELSKLILGEQIYEHTSTSARLDVGLIENVYSEKHTKSRKSSTRKLTFEEGVLLEQSQNDEEKHQNLKESNIIDSKEFNKIESDVLKEGLYSSYYALKKQEELNLENLEENPILVDEERRTDYSRGSRKERRGQNWEREIKDNEVIIVPKKKTENDEIVRIDIDKVEEDEIYQGQGENRENSMKKLKQNIKEYYEN